VDEIYRQDYAELGIPEQADWSVVRAAYRKQVNQWHPDRFAGRPRERAHAETRFIRLARSFNRLRQYYRTHDRLPFELPLRAAARGPAPLRAGPGAPAHEPTAAQELPSGEFRPDSLRPRRGAKSRTGSSVWRWAGAAAALVLCTLLAVLIIDRRERAAAAQAGQKIMEDTSGSEPFMPSEQEIRATSRRGVFIQREDGKLGDQLMPDVFR